MTQLLCISYIPDQNPILPVCAGKMGILRVNRDSPYLSKNIDVNKKQYCCVLVYLADTQQTVTLMRTMWVRRTAER